MKNLLSILILFFFSFNTLFSQNLVVNPSFEERYDKDFFPTYCEDTFFVKNWTHIYNNRYSTPDFFYERKITQLSVPYNSTGYHPAVTGKSYCGIILFDAQGGYMEHLTGKLSQPLEKGKLYEVSFYIRCPIEYSRLLSNKIEVKFSYDDSFFKKEHICYDTEWGQFYEKMFQHNTDTADLSFNIALANDTVKWLKCTKKYVAKGNEKYISLGLFRFNGEIHEKAIKFASEFDKMIMTRTSNSNTQIKRDRKLKQIQKYIPFLHRNNKFIMDVFSKEPERTNEILIGSCHPYYFIDDVSVEEIKE